MCVMFFFFQSIQKGWWGDDDDDDAFQLDQDNLFFLSKQVLNVILKIIFTWTLIFVGI